LTAQLARLTRLPNWAWLDLAALAWGLLLVLLALDRLAWSLAGLSCVACLVGLVIEGIVVVPAAVLTVWAVAITPRPAWPPRP
jgi:hypothetical protein